jgi:hypothetical protein
MRFLEWGAFELFEGVHFHKNGTSMLKWPHKVGKKKRTKANEIV